MTDRQIVGKMGKCNDCVAFIIPQEGSFVIQISLLLQLYIRFMAEFALINRSIKTDITLIFLRRMNTFKEQN